MIDLKDEILLGLAEAAAKLPPFRRGRPVTASCVLRWILDGVKVPGGGKAKLEAVRIGRRWLTSMQALERFATAQTPGLDPQPTATPRPLAARQRASERAARQLERLGI
jgi:hypothetical protein